MNFDFSHALKNKIQFLYKYGIQKCFKGQFLESFAELDRFLENLSIFSTKWSILDEFSINRSSSGNLQIGVKIGHV